MSIKEEIEENYCNLNFKTNLIKIEVGLNIYYPPNEENKESEELVINTTKTFKSNECVICLTKLPNVLFCNCGHIPICIQCDKVKGFYVCPVCETYNSIKIII